MKHIHSAIHEASKHTSRYLTGELRKEAKASGWPRHIAANMGVTYGPDGFESHVHEKHYKEAHKLEYGTETTRPTAAVRRSANRTQEAEQFFVGTLSKILGNL